MSQNDRSDTSKGFCFSFSPAVENSKASRLELRHSMTAFGKVQMMAMMSPELQPKAAKASSVSSVSSESEFASLCCVSLRLLGQVCHGTRSTVCQCACYCVQCRGDELLPGAGRCMSASVFVSGTKHFTT